jgi:hypothetical protein
LRENEVRPSTRAHLAGYISAAIVAAGTMLTLVTQVNGISETFGLKNSEATNLAERSARGAFLREMLTLTSKRVFWAQRYYGDLDVGIPADTQKQAWEKYNESVIQWNESLIYTEQMMETYYTTEKKQQFMLLNTKLHDIHVCLVYFRFPEIAKGPKAKDYEKCSEPDIVYKLITLATDQLDTLLSNLK